MLTTAAEVSALWHGMLGGAISVLVYLVYTHTKSWLVNRRVARWLSQTIDGLDKKPDWFVVGQQVSGRQYGNDYDRPVDRTGRIAEVFVAENGRHSAQIEWDVHPQLILGDEYPNEERRAYWTVWPTDAERTSISGDIL